MVNEEAFFTPSKEAFFEAMNHRTGIHFIGVGGVGMSGLARICAENGFAVSGSDISENDQTRALQAMGAHIHVGHSPASLGDNIGRVVISTAIDQDNVELKEARRQGIPVMHRSDLLAELFLVPVRKSFEPEQ